MNVDVLQWFKTFEPTCSRYLSFQRVGGRLLNVNVYNTQNPTFDESLTQKVTVGCVILLDAQWSNSVQANNFLNYCLPIKRSDRFSRGTVGVALGIQLQDIVDLVVTEGEIFLRWVDEFVVFVRGLKDRFPEKQDVWFGRTHLSSYHDTPFVTMFCKYSPTVHIKLLYTWVTRAVVYGPLRWQSLHVFGWLLLNGERSAGCCFVELRSLQKSCAPDVQVLHRLLPLQAQEHAEHFLQCAKRGLRTFTPRSSLHFGKDVVLRGYSSTPFDAHVTGGELTTKNGVFLLRPSNLASYATFHFTRPTTSSVRVCVRGCPRPLQKRCVVGASIAVSVGNVPTEPVKKGVEMSGVLYPTEQHKIFPSFMFEGSSEPVDICTVLFTPTYYTFCTSGWEVPTYIYHTGVYCFIYVKDIQSVTVQLVDVVDPRI